MKIGLHFNKLLMFTDTCTSYKELRHTSRQNSFIIQYTQYVLNSLYWLWNSEMKQKVWSWFHHFIFLIQWSCPAFSSHRHIPTNLNFQLLSSRPKNSNLVDGKLYYSVLRCSHTGTFNGHLATIFFDLRVG